MKDERLDKLISSNIEFINNIEMTIQQFISSKIKPELFNEEQHKEILISTNKAFLDLVTLFIEYGRFKDKFFPGYYHSFPYGINNNIDVEKIEQRFEIGIDIDKFFLEMWFSKPHLIKYMSDKFWFNITQLGVYGEFEFISNSSLENKDGLTFLKHFPNKKSNVFNLMRDYLFLTMYEEDVMNLGCLEVRWSSSENFLDIVKKMALTFKLLYEINYELWKVDYLQQQRVRKKYVG